MRLRGRNAEGDGTAEDETQNEQKGLKQSCAARRAPRQWRPVPNPGHENRHQRQIAERVAEIPAPPELPVMLRIAVTQRRLEPGGERHDRRVHDDRYPYVQTRAAPAS